MTKPRGPDPADVMERTCRANPGLDPALLTQKIMAALEGHGFHIEAGRPRSTSASANRTKAIAYCGGENCTRVQLHAGRCPICGWTPE